MGSTTSVPGSATEPPNVEGPQKMRRVISGPVVEHRDTALISVASQFTNSISRGLMSRPSSRVSRVLLLYTGGTIGMEASPEGYRPKKDYLTNFLRSNSLFHDSQYAAAQDVDPAYLITPALGHRIVYKVHELNPLLDSSSMTMSNWASIARLIGEHYDKYDGFVIIHGTDTMSYTASALSFMLKYLNKTVVVTGSQVPLTEQLNDGQQNLLGALLIAGHFNIPEVALFFNSKLFRGNRSSKIDASDFDAFSSPNLPPLARVGTSFDVDWSLVLPSPHPDKRLQVVTKLCSDVGVLQIFPGITLYLVEAFLTSGLRGIVLKTYGSGTGPFHEESIERVIREATSRQILIVNCPRCLHADPVNEDEEYLTSLGVVSGGNMTTEACLTKLAVVLGYDVSYEEHQRLMRTELRGEMNVIREPDPRNQTISQAVASKLFATSKREVDLVDNTLNVAMMCTASVLSDRHAVPLFQFLSKVAHPMAVHDQSLENQKSKHGRDVLFNTQSRTPLHVAAMNGNRSVVHHLLTIGANNASGLDDNGKTPLYYAVAARNMRMVQILHAGGFSSLSTHEIGTDLCIAAGSNDIEALELWHAAGADLNLTDYLGSTCLHIAIRNRHKEATQCLLGWASVLRDLPDATGTTAKYLLAHDPEFTASVYAK